MDEDLLPARMVNEFVYCPRLFYLEWAEGRFADNDDTRVGQQIHRRVDIESGAAPLPEEGELHATRSVMLSSQQLGVFGYRIRYRRVLDVQARLLAAVLVGELPEYVPMMTR